MTAQITFTASIQDFRRMKIQETPRLTLDLYPTDIKTIQQLIAAEYDQLSFQVTMIPIVKEAKPASSPQSDELSKQISQILKEYCQLSGKNIKTLIEELREKYQVDHLRSLDAPQKQGIIDFYRIKIDEIEIPEK